MPYARHTAWLPVYDQTRRAQPGTTLWAQVLHCAHGRWSNTPTHRSVFPGRWPYQMEQCPQKAMPQRCWPCKSEFQTVNLGLPEAVTRLSNVGNQLICWLWLQRSLHSCWYINSCNVWHSYSANLTTTTSIKQWTCQQRRRRANRSFSRTLRRISTSSETNKNVLPPSLH